MTKKAPRSVSTRVSVKGLHRAIEALDRRLATIQKVRPNVGSIKRMRTALKNAVEATDCDKTMVIEL